jgi:hypothetical protein
MKNSYEFKLILRGSRDGFSSSKFHEICDYQSRTTLIIKVKNSNEILGGYNPVIWKSDGSFGTTKDSFIFSFKNRGNVKENILSRPKDEKHAIVNNPCLGPAFGWQEFVLFGNKKGCVQTSACYESIRKIGLFSVEEYEVYQIMND